MSASDKQKKPARSKTVEERAQEALTGEFALEPGLQLGRLNLAMVASLRGRTRIREDLSAMYAGELIEELKKRSENVERQNRELQAAQQALRDSEERYRMLVEGMRDAIVLTDLAGNITYANHAYHRLLGFESFAEMDAVGLHRVHPDDAARLVETLPSVLAVREGTVEYRVRHKDGRWVTHHTNVCVIDGPDGEPEFLLSAVRDVTERAERESTLQKQAGRLQASLVEETQARKRRDSAIEDIASALCNGGGGSFAETLATNVQRALGVDRVVLGRFDADTHSVTALAHVGPEGPAGNVQYALGGTPCEKAVGGDVCYYTESVPRHYPECGMLCDLGVVSYMGHPLLSPDGRCVGILCVMHGAALPDLSLARDILKIFAAWAAVMLARDTRQ